MAAAGMHAGLAAAAPKQIGYVLYDIPGAQLWHQRWMLGKVATSPAEAVWASPDGDVQAEIVDGSSADIVAVRWADAIRPNPPGLGGQAVYRFRAAPTAARLARWMVEAEAVAVDVFRARIPGAVVPVACLEPERVSPLLEA